MSNLPRIDIAQLLIEPAIHPDHHIQTSSTHNTRHTKMYPPQVIHEDRVAENLRKEQSRTKCEPISKKKFKTIKELH